MIRLEKFSKKDFPQLIEWINNEKLLFSWSGSLFKFPLTESSLEWYINDTNNPESSDAYVFKAVDEVSGKTVGHISLGGISRKNRAARISRVLVGETAERGKGTCQAMIRAILKIGFEELNLHRIGLGVYDNNLSALKCYEKAGFKQEGIHRDIFLHEGNWWSMVEMSILEDEWRSLNSGEKSGQ